MDTRFFFCNFSCKKIIAWLYVLCVDPQAAAYALSFTVNKRFGRGDDEISLFVKFAADFFGKPKIK